MKSGAAAAPEATEPTAGTALVTPERGRPPASPATEHLQPVICQPCFGEDDIAASMSSHVSALRLLLVQASQDDALSLLKDLDALRAEALQVVAAPLQLVLREAASSESATSEAAASAGSIGRSESASCSSSDGFGGIDSGPSWMTGLARDGMQFTGMQPVMDYGSGQDSDSGSDSGADSRSDSGAESESANRVRRNARRKDLPAGAKTVPCERHHPLVGTPGAKCEAEDMLEVPGIVDLIDRRITALRFVHADDLEAGRRAARYEAYRAYLKFRFAEPLGSGRRVQLPDCAVKAIRELFPSPKCCPETCDFLRGCERAKHYVGFRTTAQSRLLRNLYSYVD